MNIQRDLVQSAAVAIRADHEFVIFRPVAPPFFAQLSIENSGESAIDADGDRVEIEMVDVTILDADSADASLSDDAIRVAPAVSGSLTMRGGSIDGVPGRLGDGIVLQNTDPARTVDLALVVSGASFSNIGQDAIRVDNENGLVEVEIGGLDAAAANVFSDVGFRGIVIETDGDPGNRSNRVLVANNIVSAAHEGIQIRGIDDIGVVSILDNAIDTAVTTVLADAIDWQQDLGSRVEARVSGNHLFGNDSADDTGVRVRLFEGAQLALEMAGNDLDNFDSGFVMQSREASGTVTTRLDATVVDNLLTDMSLPQLAMSAGTQHPGSEFCLDLRNNSAVSDYEIAVPAGLFELTLGSQAVSVVQGAIGGSPVACTLPAF